MASLAFLGEVLVLAVDQTPLEHSDPFRHMEVDQHLGEVGQVALEHVDLFQYMEEVRHQVGMAKLRFRIA
jgi:hypothetical protein